MMSTLVASLVLGINSLRARPVRTVLLVGAAALAASLIVAVSCTLGSVQNTVRGEITKFLGKVDARITHSAEGRFDESIVEHFRTMDEVDFATGVAFGQLVLVHADARLEPGTDRILRQTVSAVGADLPLELTIRPLPLRAGTWPVEPNDVLLDPLAAESLHATVGDQLKIQYLGEPIVLTVTGIFDRKTIGILQRPLVRIDLDILQRISGNTHEVSYVRIGLADGVDVKAFCARHGETLDTTLLLEPAELVKSGFDRRILITELGLFIMSMLTFTCAAFIIVTGMTTSVTEQQRQLAIFRCIGASRLQLFGTQVCIGLIIGLGGSLIGIPLGIALSWGLVAWFSELLTGGFVVHSMGIRLAVLGSFGAGVLGALYPAWQAAHISPLRALSSVARPVARHTVFVFGIVALLLIGLQLLFYSSDDDEFRFWSYAYFGVHALVIGYFLLATVVFVIVVRLLGRPLARLLGLPRDLIRGSMLTTPHRHGFTAGALMLGIALLVATWSTTMSVLNGWVRDITFADGFAFQLSGLTPENVNAISALDGVEETTVIGMMPAEIVGQQVFGIKEFVSPTVQCLSFQPDQFFRMNAIRWIAGNPVTAIPRLESGEGLVVAERFLTARGITVGDQLTLKAGRLEGTFEIVGVLESNGLDIVTQLYGFRNRYMDYAMSCVFMDADVVADVFDNREALMMQINLSDDVDDEAIGERITEVAPGVRFINGRWILATINTLAATVLTVQTIVAFAALLLASIGVGNVILAGVYDRRYEFGVFRAVGGSRRNVVRALLGESALLALTGAITGTMLGYHVAWVDTENLRSMAGIDAPLRLQIIPTLIGWFILLLLTMLVTLPGILKIVRSTPSSLLSAGRAG
jgi:putative ABC transport system permease protein